MHIPTTSKTLLRNLGEDARSARWTEFVARYRPMMEAFLAARFPSLASEAEDVIQETLLVLVRALPGYRYSPGETGAFHNYLTGILHHRASMRLRTRERESRNGAAASLDSSGGTPATPDLLCEERDETAWREALFEVALRQLLADDSILERTKQVFVRLAVRGEPLEDVATSFGIARNAAAQIRFRMTRCLRATVEALARAAESADPA